MFVHTFPLPQTRSCCVFAPPCCCQGATESNNLAIKGVAKFYKENKNHVITTQTVRHGSPSRWCCRATAVNQWLLGVCTCVYQEHKCVLDSCRWLELNGFEVTYLPVKPNGLIDVAELEAAIR